MTVDNCYKMAGAAGIEPANAGIKSRCLTAWRRPIILAIYMLADVNIVPAAAAL